MQEKITIGYCRSASHRQGDYLQMDEEKRGVEEFAKKHNLLISTIYFDWGVSGMTLDRPQWKRLMEDCKSGNVGTLIVPDLDRIARDWVLKKRALDTFGQMGVCVKSATENDALGFSLGVLGGTEELKRQ